jgi:VanZ family protein
MKEKLQKNIGWIFFGYSLLIMIVAVLPINSTGHRIDRVHIGTFRLDHLIHTAQFLIWGMIAWYYMTTKNKGRKKIATIYIAGFILAISSEFVQYWLPYRGFGLYDLIGNLSGVVLALIGGIIASVIKK